MSAPSNAKSAAAPEPDAHEQPGAQRAWRRLGIRAAIRGIDGASSPLALPTQTRLYSDGDDWYPRSRMQDQPLNINQESLKAERDRLKEALKEIEIEQRKTEAQLKALRQREIRAKRQVEALTTLLEIQDETSA